MSEPAPWRVEFASDAAEVVRKQPQVVRAVLSDLFDGMADGPPTKSTRDEAVPNGWVVRTHSGLDVAFLVRADDRVILVYRVRSAPGSPRPDLESGALSDRIAAFAGEARFATRRLRRAPTFTLGVILTLAVGLGGASTVFGLVHTVFRGALPFEDGDRMVRIQSRNVDATGATFAFSVTPRDFHLVRDGNRVFEGVVAQSGGSVALLGDGPPQRVSVIGVTSGWAPLLGIEPTYGRVFTADEEAAGREAGVALISHQLWQTRFGADPAVLESEIRYDGGRFTVVGILPPRFAYPYDAEIWTPWRVDATDWTSSDLNVVARLRPGVDVAAAGEDSDRLYVALKEATPGVAPNAGFMVMTSREDFIRSGAASLQGLAVAVVFLLLLVCVNIANLFVARRAAEQREHALRSALGASRTWLLGAALVESMLLFVVGGALGLLLVGPLGRASSILIPDVLRTQLDLGAVSLGWPMVCSTIAVSLLGGLVTGVLAASSTARSDIQSVLRDGDRGNARSGGRLRDGLVVFELALSFVLLVGAAVLSDHFRRLQGADLGFETSDVMTAQLALQHERFLDPETRSRTVADLEEALARLPGVDAVGVTSVNPICCGNWGARIQVDGMERPADAPPITLHHRYVTPAYFPTMSIPIVRGRAFDATDRPESTPSVIVDEDAAARFWPGEDPIGRRIGWDIEGSELRTVVGVAARAHAEGDPRPTWYLPLYQNPTGRSNEVVHFMIRGAAPDAQSLRRAVAEVDPTLALFGVTTMDQLRTEGFAQDRMGAAVAVMFAVSGLLLAAIGLYGLLAYQVERRRREIGTRRALGATRMEVGRLVYSRTGRLLAIGLLTGAVLAYGVNEAIVRIVEGVEIAGPGLFSLLMLVLGVTATVATAIPARRAWEANPSDVLRE